MGLLDWLFGGRRKDHGRRDVADASLTPRAPPALAPVQTQRVRRIVWREGSYPMDVVGESQFQEALSRICGPHNRYGHKAEADAFLIREPHNPHDPNAVAVEIYGEKIGYLSREEAERVGGQMDHEGLKRVGCGAIITGGWRTNQYDEGSFGVRLGIPRWDWIDMGTGREPPPRPVVERRRPVPVKRPEAAAEGPLVGERVVLWGLSDTGPEALELASFGARIMAGVGISTTMLIHSEDALTAGAKGSAVYLNAQERIAAGSRLEIVSLRELRARLGPEKMS